ncbi:hypothetical protein TraAM80_04403 [Trypanosoma rangeli]|uniref:Uncharacterized protein n=1 Tax=Trypanosoma rangeli TaxID=5698 RepID=A0A3S5IRB4_TRYRA|nr:uncharacterized protein TraAM80_04403 [Trypanosoma rangeli]RNF05681.1 hypothetical protein TraAM80_04403 [Trypanosoma rangeli]|eukprot:RNF05681.1 hypothetical protein TraAM80_04403 [Trypanosoma rangeli]
MQNGIRERQAKQHFLRRRTVRRQAEDVIGPLEEHDVNTHVTKRKIPSQRQWRQSCDRDTAQSIPLQQGTETRHEAGTASNDDVRRVNPLDSLCAITVVSIGGSDSDEDKVGEGESRDGHNSLAQEAIPARRTTEAAHRKSGFKRKLLPSRMSSPPSRFPAFLPPQGGVRPGRLQQRQHICQRGRKGDLFTEEESSVFAALAAVDEDNGHGDKMDDSGGYEDESVVVCPFRLMGGCLKGQHTQRELLSNQTIYSHLMSLAGLVHELRTEQRITVKECQRLHLLVASQRMTIERLEKCILSQTTAPGGFPHPEVALRHEMRSTVSRNTAGGNTENNTVPETKPLNTRKLHVQGGSFAQHVRRRTSMTTPVFVSGETQVAENGGSLVGDEEKRAGDAKHMAEKVGTPTEMSRSALNVSQLNETRGASGAGATKHTGGNRWLKSSSWRAYTIREQIESHEAAVGVVDDFCAEDVSPISTVFGSQGEEVSFNDEVILTVACGVHPPGGPARLPAPDERRPGNLKGPVRKRHERLNATADNVTTSRVTHRRFHSFDSHTAKAKHTAQHAALFCGHHWK